MMIMETIQDLKDYITTVQDLKDYITGLRVELVRRNIPIGHCPYAYYPADKKTEIDCDNSCNDCEEEFYNNNHKSNQTNIYNFFNNIVIQENSRSNKFINNKIKEPI